MEKKTIAVSLHQKKKKRRKNTSSVIVRLQPFTRSHLQVTRVLTPRPVCPRVHPVIGHFEPMYIRRVVELKANPVPLRTLGSQTREKLYESFYYFFCLSPVGSLLFDLRSFPMKITRRYISNLTTVK